MAVSFNKEVISEAIQEVLAEDQKIPVRVSSKSDSSDTGSIEVMDKDKMDALKRTGKVEVDPMEEDHHENPNDESNMAKSQLYAIAKYAIELLQLIKDGDQLDAWVQAKITKAADYVDAVQHYLEGEEYLDNNHGESDAELNELFGRVKNKTVNYKGHDYKILDIDSAGTFTLIDPQDPSAEAFHVNRAQMKAGRVPDVKAPEVEDVPLVNLKEEEDAEPSKADLKKEKGFAAQSTADQKKAARKKALKPILDKLEKSGVISRVDGKLKVNDIDAYKKAISAVEEAINEVLAETKATCCGKCGRTHVKGSGCKRPFLTGQDHCRVR